MKFFVFFFVALAAVLALVGADVNFAKGEPLLREARSAAGDVAPGKGGKGGGGGYGYGKGGGYYKG